MGKMSFLDDVDIKDEIAITGMSCTFPEADNLNEYWDNLYKGKDCIKLNPRWDVSNAKAKHGGFISGMDYFDNEFFGLSYAEAVNMDPQQRLILEQGYGAICQAGYTKEDINEENIGVFVGICGNDMVKFQDKPTVYSATGAAHSIAANRFSYIL